MFNLSPSRRSKGFTLVEMLLVLAILGIISVIAIPSYLAQRRRARVIGDAIANAKVLQMGLETRRAVDGLYGVASQTYGWKADGSDATGPALIPTFEPKGASKMNFSVTIDPSGVAYVMTVTDPSLGNATAYQTNQSGAELARLAY